MLQQVVDVERVLPYKYCPDCVYKNNTLKKQCGPCHEKAIEARVKWWQEGKKNLKRRYKNDL